MGDQKIYYKVYQDKNNTDSGYFVTDLENIKQSLDVWIEEHLESGELFPCIEPVLMTQKQYAKLPEFDGY